MIALTALELALVVDRRRDRLSPNDVADYGQADDLGGGGLDAKPGVR